MTTGDAAALLAALEERSDRPLRAMVEIADRCNEVCVHCYQEQGRKGEMSTDDLKRLFDDLAASGVLILTLSGGEATLRKDFVELVRYARNLGFALRIFTNGLTMTRALARELAEQAVQTVEISLYSHRAEVHDFVTGVPRSFERTVAGIRYLVAEGVNVHVKTPTLSVNESEVDKYIAFATGLGATYALDPTMLMPREGGSRDPQAFSRSEETYEGLLATLGPRVPKGELPQKSLAAPLCGAGAAIHVEPNGELRPCTMLDLNLGHAVKDGVERARATNKNLEALRALRWSDVHGCRDCDLRAYCVRCHASALAEVGDALAPYPTACSAARTQYALASGAAPRIAVSVGRDASVGPYMKRDDGTFEAIEDVCTTEDEALARRLGWIRRAAGPMPAPERHVRPGDLVQLRRPGSAGRRTERVPSGERSNLSYGGR